MENALEKLTVAMENYLEAVYELSQAASGARLTDIATRMNVTKASANNAMAVLAEKGLITNAKYQEITLTADGTRLARLVSGKHAALQRFFIEVLGVEASIAEADACAIEHVVSRETIEAVELYLKNSAKAKEQ
jgi:Mn-dependent DtxR family transcriptional regulator